MAQLEEGLRLLNQADPFVEVSMQDSGEHVIGAAGLCLSLMTVFSTLLSGTDPELSGSSSSSRRNAALAGCSEP